MTEFKIPRAYEIAREVLDNVLSLGDDLVAGQFAENELDTGGIEVEAYFATLYADWKEAHETMGLPADEDTYRHYIYVRHLALFGIRQDNFGNFVAAEKRVPPRLTPDENLTLIEEVKRDMELVHNGEARLAASGSLDYRSLPNDGPGDSTRSTKHFNSIPLYRPSRPSDVFGTPDAPPVEIPNRLMRPDDGFGTPGTRIYRGERQAHSSLRAPDGNPAGGRTYSLSIRPGETKTQVIELPGLTLELVITMPGNYPRAG